MRWNRTHTSSSHHFTISHVALGGAWGVQWPTATAMRGNFVLHGPGLVSLQPSGHETQLHFEDNYLTSRWIPSILAPRMFHLNLLSTQRREHLSRGMAIHRRDIRRYYYFIGNLCTMSSLPSTSIPHEACPCQCRYPSITGE